MMDTHRIFRGQWDRMTVIDAHSEEVKPDVASKKTIAEIVRAQGKDVVDIFLDPAVADRLELVFDL